MKGLFSRLLHTIDFEQPLQIIAILLRKLFKISCSLI
jgi:hypothetical protein